MTSFVDLPHISRLGFLTPDGKAFITWRVKEQLEAQKKHCAALSTIKQHHESSGEPFPFLVDVGDNPRLPKLGSVTAVFVKSQMAADSIIKSEWYLNHARYWVKEFRVFPMHWRTPLCPDGTYQVIDTDLWFMHPVLQLRWLILCAYTYYACDFNIVSDAVYDVLAKICLSNLAYYKKHQTPELTQVTVDSEHSTLSLYDKINAPLKTKIAAKAFQNHSLIKQTLT